MADRAEVDVDKLANAIRYFDGDHKKGAGELAADLATSPALTDLTSEVERSRASETNFLRHGMYLTTALKDVTDLVQSDPDSEISKKISSIMDKMWQDIGEKSPGKAESLWGQLSRSEQEEYRDIHYEPGQAGGEARSHELEDLARRRLAEQ